jgi:6-phosphogluconate dehydrogenase
LLDLGTSGGVSGARNGACFMLGGDPEAVKTVEPILTELCVPGGYVYTGPAGSGHFVKLVHNGIEFGMLQAIGEGMELLANYRHKLDLTQILTCWNSGSVVRSWLIELMKQVYNEQGGFEKVPAYVEDTGEVNWLITDAMQMDVPVPVIAQSVMQLISSRDSNQFAHKAIAMMRHGFGDHPFGPNEGVKRERQHGQVGKYVAVGPVEAPSTLK